jgi:predicted transcriptional regulator
MADHTFRLSADLTGRIATLASDLRMEAQEHRDAWDEKSEKWQEGEKGTVTDGWIEELDELADALENVSDEPV